MRSGKDLCCTREITQIPHFLMTIESAAKPSLPMPSGTSKPYCPNAFGNQPFYCPNAFWNLSTLLPQCIVGPFNLSTAPMHFGTSFTSQDVMNEHQTEDGGWKGSKLTPPTWPKKGKFLSASKILDGFLSYLINVRWIFYLSVYLAAKPKSEVPALCVGSEDEATGQVSSGQDFMKEQRTKDLDG